MCLTKIGLHAQSTISILDLIVNAIDSLATPGNQQGTQPTSVGAPWQAATSGGAYARVVRYPG